MSEILAVDMLADLVTGALQVEQVNGYIVEFFRDVLGDIKGPEALDERDDTNNTPTARESLVGAMEEGGDMTEW